MIKIRKYQMLEFLKVFKMKDCKTIDDIIKLLDKELKSNNDVVFEWKKGEW